MEKFIMDELMELDEDYFNIAKERIENHELKDF